MPDPKTMGSRVKPKILLNSLLYMVADAPIAAWFKSGGIKQQGKRVFQVIRSRGVMPKAESDYGFDSRHVHQF